MSELVPFGKIRDHIILLRGQRVMLSPHLADLYGVPSKVLVQAVKRNLARFPADFMFQLTAEEFRILRSQIVTSRSTGWGGARYPPMAFTEHGVAMISTVLNSKRAVAVNIQIVRTFVQLRQWLIDGRDLAAKVAEIEKRYDSQFRVVFEALEQLMAPPKPPPRKPIGF